MDLDLQGSIEKFTLPEIFQLIAAGRKSGTLGIQKDESIVMIYFRNGDIIYGYGPRQTYHLGQLLKERGLLSAQQLDESVMAQARTDNSLRLGEILIKKRFIDRADLEKVVREQIEQLLYSLLAWQSGSFKFYEDQFPTEEEITVNLSVENVILEGLRRHDEMSMVREVLPDFERVYTISASQKGRARAVTMEAAEWNVMALVDGFRTVNEICDNSSMPREETLKVLAKLKLAGIITPAERKQVAEASSGELEEMVQRLAGLFEDYLKEKTTAPTANRRVTETVLGEQQ
ncbi:DUF4388 domain-containing protein [candidate division GN15 bacterium]|nr:DUF4388 domain-containing protein [candidate division GN15 bacterium]